MHPASWFRPFRSSKGVSAPQQRGQRVAPHGGRRIRSWVPCRGRKTDQVRGSEGLMAGSRQFLRNRLPGRSFGRSTGNSRRDMKRRIPDRSADAPNSGCWLRIEMPSSETMPRPIARSTRVPARCTFKAWRRRSRNAPPPGGAPSKSATSSSRSTRGCTRPRSRPRNMASLSGSLQLCRI